MPRLGSDVDRFDLPFEPESFRVQLDAWIGSEREGWHGFDGTGGVEAWSHQSEARNPSSHGEAAHATMCSCNVEM